MERQFYESHISLFFPPLYFLHFHTSVQFFLLRVPFFFFFFFNFFSPPPCSPCFKKSNPLSVVPFGPHYQHWLFSCFRNAQERLCFFFYYDSLLLFFLNIFLSPSPSHSFSLFSLFLSRFRIHLLIFFRHALRSVSCSSSSFYFFFFSSSPPLRTLQSTLINELISTS